MTDRRDADKRVKSDLLRLKQRVRSLEAERAEYVERWLGDRLKHPTDFERLSGPTIVEDSDGRINWLVLEQRLAQFLSERPELSA